MKKTIISTLIGAVATILAAVIGVYAGRNVEHKSIQNEMNEVMGDMVNVIGDGNEVTINDIKELMEEYQSLQAQNQSLTDQNMKYFADLTDANARLEEFEDQSNIQMQELEEQINSMPDIQFKDIGLSVEGEEIPVNSKASSIVVNNRTYYSEEFIRNLIDDHTTISIQDNMMYIGKIIKEKGYLLDEWKVDGSCAFAYDSVTDSYGNMHTNSLVFDGQSCYIMYNLNREYSLMKFKLSVRENADMDKQGTLTIKADDTIVYTSPTLSKTTEEFEVADIPIDNCSLLKIEYNEIGQNDCIMSDIEIYN